MESKLVELTKELRDLRNKLAYQEHAIKGMSTEMKLLTKEVQQINLELEGHGY